MMRKFIRFMATAAAMIVSVLSMTAAEPLSLTRLVYKDGTYLYSTFCADTDLPLATYEEISVSEYRIILFSDDVEKKYEFKVKVPSEKYLGKLRISASRNVPESDRFYCNGDAYIGEILVTQHLFNDDDLYEYIIGRIEGEGVQYVYDVYNENGEYLGEIAHNTLYVDKDEIYIYEEYNKYKNDGSQRKDISSLYRINKKKGTKVAELRDVPQGLRSIPNPVGEDETVTVLLPEGLFAGATVQVYSMNGSLLVRRECKAGEMSVEIAAHALSRGVNPVIVVDADGNVVSSGKIVRE